MCVCACVCVYIYIYVTDVEVIDHASIINITIARAAALEHPTAGICDTHTHTHTHTHT